MLTDDTQALQFSDRERVLDEIAKAPAGAFDPVPRELAAELTVRRQPGSRWDERDGDASSGAETCMFLATVALASHRSADAR